MVDVKSILEELDGAEIFEEEGSRIQRVFIGTVFSILPSGKYYLPYACSNLDPCPCCNGTGSVRVKGASERLYKKKKARRAKLLKILKARFGSGYMVDWPEKSKEEFLRVSRLVRRSETKKSCRRCDGMGSHEAADDSRFMEKLERELDEHGLWIEGGEGDPCDLFVGRCLPDLSEEEVEEEEMAHSEL
jgi:hypothetical protein